MSSPWYTFSWLENFGTIDPQGNYWKPDVNVQAPGGAPITALLPGTVTDVRRTGFGQGTITIKLDQAINSLATHTFYEHLGSTNVQVGQRVSTGTLLGYNNPSGQVPVGFGFYSGDIYGSGSAWNTLQQDLAPGGKGLLNPGKIFGVPEGGSLNSANLNMAQNTKDNSSTQGGSGQQSGVCAPWDITCIMQNIFLNIAHSDTVERGILLFFGMVVIVIGLTSLSNTKKE